MSSYLVYVIGYLHFGHLVFWVSMPECKIFNEEDFCEWQNKCEMGIRFRKSFKVAPGVRVNVGKKSVGVSVGGRAGHISVNSDGRKTIGGSIPGTGISYSESLGSSSNSDHYVENSSSCNSDQNTHYNGGGANDGGPESPSPNNKKGSCIIYALLAVVFISGFYWCYALYWFIRRRGDRKKDIAVYALGVLSALLLVGYASTSDSGSAAPATETVVTSTPEATPEPTITAESTPTATPEPTPAPNTSEMVDYIAQQAKTSAEESVSDAKRDEAVEYIRANYPNYYSDNAAMEKAMYYGYYLEYAYEENGSSDPYAVLGMNTYQAVKYVYRGAETVDAQSTQENLGQIAENLAALGISVSTSEASVQSDTPDQPMDTPSDSSSGEPAPADTQVSTPEPTPQAEMVWVDDSAAKYHEKSDCSGMDAAYQVTKEEAEAMGKTPCKRCYR